MPLPCTFMVLQGPGWAQDQCAKINEILESPLMPLISYVGQICVSFFMKTHVDNLSFVQGRKADPTKLSCYLHKERSAGSNPKGEAYTGEMH